MPNTTHEISKTDHASELKTLYVFAVNGPQATITVYRGQLEDERHYSEGWGQRGETKIVSREAARKEWAALRAQGFGG